MDKPKNQLEPSEDASAPTNAIPGGLPLDSNALRVEAGILYHSPKLNLFRQDDPIIEIPGSEGSATVPSKVEAASQPGVIKKSKTGLIVGALVLFLFLSATGAYAMFKPKPGLMNKIAPAVPTVVSVRQSPILTPTPTATATPSPVVLSLPQTVSAPTVVPTSDHPQLVVVMSKNGLWLRKSPTSLNQKNVIGWIPNGASVSVDATGDFWWHGTYSGKTGYFASKYTQ